MNQLLNDDQSLDLNALSSF